ncbi:MAG: hypothetical protein HKM02_10260 [Pseudomonadales bacterium]|nr:hypothetical protein [Pseudomonadales bacterium]
MSRGAHASQASLMSRLIHWRQDHQQQATESLKRLLQQPASSLLTISVIALALALPTALLTLLLDTRQLVASVNDQASLSIYLPAQLSLPDAIHQLGSVKGISHISAQDAAASLKEFEALTSSHDSLRLLGQNPLPAVITVFPVAYDAASLQALHDQLTEQLPKADVELDLAWLSRLDAALEILRRLFLLLFISMTLAVLLVITNTIRLAIESRRDEIITLKLLGATHGMVRRPFLYMGFWSGLCGGLLGCGLVRLGLLWLNIPVLHLAQMYHTSFSINGPSLLTWILLPSLALLLGVLGAYMAMYRHLKALEPR